MTGWGIMGKTKREEKTENTWWLLTTMCFQVPDAHMETSSWCICGCSMFTFELRHSISWWHYQVNLANTAHIKTSKHSLCILILHQDLGREEEQDVTPSLAARRLEPQLWTLKRVKTNHCKHRNANWIVCISVTPPVAPMGKLPGSVLSPPVTEEPLWWPTDPFLSSPSLSPWFRWRLHPIYHGSLRCRGRSAAVAQPPSVC